MFEDRVGRRKTDAASLDSKQSRGRSVGQSKAQATIVAIATPA